MELRLTAEQEALVNEAIRSGRYDREEEVLREALSLWEHQERRRAEIMAAVDQAEATFSRGAARRITRRKNAGRLRKMSSAEGLHGCKRNNRQPLTTATKNPRNRRGPSGSDRWLFVSCPRLRRSLMTSGFTLPNEPEA